MFQSLPMKTLFHMQVLCPFVSLIVQINCMSHFEIWVEGASPVAIWGIFCSPWINRVQECEIIMLNSSYTLTFHWSKSNHTGMPCINETKNDTLPKVGITEKIYTSKEGVYY